MRPRILEPFEKENQLDIGFTHIVRPCKTCSPFVISRLWFSDIKSIYNGAFYLEYLTQFH